VTAASNVQSGRRVHRHRTVRGADEQLDLRALKDGALGARRDTCGQDDCLAFHINIQSIENGTPELIEGHHQPSPSMIERMPWYDVPEMGICVNAGPVEASPLKVKVCFPGMLNR